MSSGLGQIKKDLKTMKTISRLSTVFESIASLRIAQTRNQVLQSQQFFSELWHIYTQIRAGNTFRFGRGNSQVIDKELFVVVTAAGGLFGDIDQKLIDWMLSKFDPKKNDIIVIGHHGAVQLTQDKVPFKKYFELPIIDKNINVDPLVRQIQAYRDCTVYYQTYISLMVQDIKRLELNRAVQEQGKQIKTKQADVISEATYIFEPSAQAVVDHLERSMLHIMLEQIILESKLAQYASRFRAMSAAEDKAEDFVEKLTANFNHTRRVQKDERIKEIVNSLKVGS